MSVRSPALCLLALLALAAPAAPALAADPPCGPEPDLTALLSALDAPGATEAARDASTVIREYQTRAEALCRAVAALSTETRHLREGLMAAEMALDLAGREADLLRDAYTRALTRRQGQGRALLGWAVGGGACSDLDGRISLCGAAVWGWRF